ncbi:MAG: TonB-dependent receptor [Rhodospirillaceae bacterium]|nr:MAG: TonB-dependent receptor [Rhodospirillaceae bacterium]
MTPMSSRARHIRLFGRTVTKSTWFHIASAIALITSGTDAHAQSMDYGAFEQLFGEPVTTSATGSPQRQSDVPANMEIITQDDIRRSGADNIPDILQFVAGIDVRRYGASQADVSVRGYDQPYSPSLLVLINGRQVYNDTFGYTAWETLPVQLDEIRQIEVVKGPNSALFGFNALGGVINIITYDPLADSTDVATVRGGTQGLAGASAVGTLHFGDRGGVRLSAGGSRSHEFPTAGLPPSNAGVPYYVTPYHYAFSADGRFKAAPGVEITTEATASKMRDFEALPVVAPSGDISYRTNSLKFGINADTRYGLLEVLAYRNNLQITQPNISGIDTHENNTVYVVQANDLFKIGSDHTIRLGVEYRDNAEFSGVLLQGTVGYNIYAASGMWNWNVSPKVSLTNAVRLDYMTLNYTGTLVPGSRYTLADYNNTTLTVPSFNSGLVYKPTADDTIRLSVARGIRAPSLIDLGLQDISPIAPGFSVLYIGNPHLEPTSLMNYEVDYDRAIRPLRSTLRLAAYYQKTGDVIIDAVGIPLMPAVGGLAAYSQNVGGSEAYGGEIGLKGTDPSGLRWNASYALISIKDHGTLGALTGYSSAYSYSQGGTPTSVVRFGIGYSAGRFEMDLQGKWQSHFTDFSANAFGGANPVRINNYTTVNARVGYSLTEQVTLAVTGEQLGRTQIFETAGAPVQRRVFVTMTLRR